MPTQNNVTNTVAENKTLTDADSTETAAEPPHQSQSMASDANVVTTSTVGSSTRPPTPNPTPVAHPPTAQLLPKTPLQGLEVAHVGIPNSIEELSATSASAMASSTLLNRPIPPQIPLQMNDVVTVGVPQSNPPYYKSTDQNWNGVSGYNYKPTNQSWNGMSGYNFAPGPGGSSYDFGLQGFNSEFGGHMGSSGVPGFNMLMGQTQAAWLVAQNPGGNLEFDAGGAMSWDFSGTSLANETNMPRPTDHPLPMPPSSIAGERHPSIAPHEMDMPRPTDHLLPMPPSSIAGEKHPSIAPHEMNMRRPTDHLLPMPPSSIAGEKHPSIAPPAPQLAGRPADATGKFQMEPVSNIGASVESLEDLGTRVRKPTARKEVVPLTEITNTEDDNMPEWMVLAMGYLNDGLGSKDWLDCIDAWAEFEKKIGLRNSTSVSTNL